MDGSRQTNKKAMRGLTTPTPTTLATKTTTTPPKTAAAASLSATPGQASSTKPKPRKTKKEEDRNGKKDSAKETTSNDQIPTQKNMEKAKTPPPPRTQPTTPDIAQGATTAATTIAGPEEAEALVASDKTITIGILLFNVSCGSGTSNAATGSALIDGIQAVLKQVKHLIDNEDSLFFSLVTDKITEEKYDEIEGFDLVAVQGYTEVAEAIIFSNDNKQEIEDVTTWKRSNARINLAIDETGVVEKLSNLVEDLNAFQKEEHRSCFTETEIQSLHDAEQKAKKYVEKTKEILGNIYKTKIPAILSEYLWGTSFFWSLSILPLNVRLLVVCWHGPHKASDREHIFRELVQFVENLRKEYKADVAMIGGDFNLSAVSPIPNAPPNDGPPPDDPPQSDPPQNAPPQGDPPQDDPPQDDRTQVVQLILNTMTSKGLIPPAVVHLLQVEQKRDAVLDYLVVWSKGFTVTSTGNQLFLPSDTDQIPPNAQKGLWPFDHPVLLYKLEIKRDST